MTGSRSCRYEYVNTKQNPADVLSREAWEDPQFAIGLRVEYSLSKVSDYVAALGLVPS